MLRLPEFFILPGTFTPAFLVGACNAVGSDKERRRWVTEYRSGCADRDAADNGFDDGFSKAAALIRIHGRRAAKRAIVRLSREVRGFRRRCRDRGIHVAGRGEVRALKDYRAF